MSRDDGSRERHPPGESLSQLRPWRRWMSGSAAPEGGDEAEGAPVLSCAGECRRLIESSLVGVVVGELGGDIVDVNAHFLALTGYGRGDLPLRWNETIRPGDPGAEQGRIRSLLERAEVPAWETVLVGKDAVQVPVLVAATRLGDAGLGCAAFVVDLTRARDAEIALERSEALHRALFDQSPSLSITLDRAGSILAVNAHGARKLGYDKSELVGQPVFAFADAADRAILRDLMEVAASTADAVASRELRYLRKDGRTLWTAGSVRSIPGAGAGGHFLLVCKDITELKGTQQQILAHQERLRALTSALALAEERERRRIATGLHDEVGHSLALAQIRLGMIEKEAAGDAREELAPVRALLAEAIDTIRSLTFDLSSPVLYEIGLGAAIQSVGERIAGAMGVPFGFECDDGPEPSSEDRRVLLFRSVRELLLNAAKHSGARHVDVTMNTEGGELRIRVADDGRGFDAADLMRPAGPGVGHGLLRAAEQIESMGGSLEVDSAPGEGTRCRIVVPLEA